MFELTEIMSKNIFTLAHVMLLTILMNVFIAKWNEANTTDEWNKLCVWVCFARMCMFDAHRLPIKLSTA